MFWRSLRHPQRELLSRLKTMCYCKVVIVVKLQKMEYIICRFFTNSQLLKLTSGYYKGSGILE